MDSFYFFHNINRFQINIDIVFYKILLILRRYGCRDGYEIIGQDTTYTCDLSEQWVSGGAVSPSPSPTTSPSMGLQGRRSEHTVLHSFQAKKVQ